MKSKLYFVASPKSKVTIDEIKPGERVVVTAMETKAKDGETTMVASEVRLGGAGTTASKQ